MTKHSTFCADGVLFDMDGTLTDSIAAVEAAWTAKAEQLGLEPAVVIAATHGRRASDNLQDLIPGLLKANIEQEVEVFERSILEFADNPRHSRRSSFRSEALEACGQSTVSTPSSTGPVTPSSVDNASRGPSTTHDLLPASVSHLAEYTNESPFLDDEIDDPKDMSVRILPGVRELIDSLPDGTYAVATSGAKTYCHGCLTRTNITIPKVCVTADDARLTRGKPFPDPFLLAAADLGIDPKRSVIFEDSPSGIKAAVAAGGTVIAVCTSHSRAQIDQLGAHYVVDTLEQVKVESKGGELVFTVQH